MKIDVSIGEIFDKLTILEIKLINISEENKVKRDNVLKEYEKLRFIYNECNYEENNELHNLVTELYNINTKLWNIEDRIRQKEKNKQFDLDFIELARSVYVTNDKRSEIKKKINELTKSELVEEKSYEKYE